MSKKIIAIGGGENGRVTRSGNKMPYELREIDNEIVSLAKLSEKNKPNFLFLGHAQNNAQNELLYFDTMKSIYGNVFNCGCKAILKKDVAGGNLSTIKKDIDWADIIYVGGGDTKGMMDLWRSTGFDMLLEEAWREGKVMCGVSAGANCWFKSCSSDSLKIQLNDSSAPMITVNCLGFINAFFTPHCDETDRLGHMEESLKNTDLIGIGISNCCALEIIDDEYRLICCDASNYGIDAYGVKTYYRNGEYISDKICNTEDFKPIGELLRKGATVYDKKE